MIKNKILSIKDIEKVFLDRNEHFKKKFLKKFYKKEIFKIKIYKNKYAIYYQIVKDIKNNTIQPLNKKNKILWNTRWQKYLKNTANNVPYWIKENKIFRFNYNYIKSLNQNFNISIIGIYFNHIFYKYFKKKKYIYEFGCGSGFNLFLLKQLFPSKQLFGLDYSDTALKILKKKNTLLNNKIKINKFDMTKKNKKYILKKNSAVLTSGALEQLGKNFKNFINFLILNKPEIVVNIEPIEELYNKNSSFDQIALFYNKKKKFLSGYLNYLFFLQKTKKIIILKIKKNNFGSRNHDGHSLIVWKPI